MNRRLLLQLASAAALVPSVASAMQEVALGIHVRHGVDEEATVANQDGIANIGFIVGERSVAVIDPGGSLADGQALRAQIRATTPLPISHLVITHLHPDHAFGAVAFEDDHPRIVAHARMLPMLVSRGEFYRNRLADVLGLEAAGDYAKPDLLVHDTLTIDLGARPLELRAYKTAHTDNDLTAFDVDTGTLWTGDLLFVDRVPALDGSLAGWLAALRTLRTVKASRAVPGHGPVAVDWPAALDAEERYLTLIATQVRAIIARGGSIEQAVATVGLAERGQWALFDDYNGRNVTAAFKELEWE